LIQGSQPIGSKPCLANMGVFAQTDKSDYSRTSPPESWGTGIRANSPMS
jgi:hypothetical protein